MKRSIGIVLFITVLVVCIFLYTKQGKPQSKPSSVETESEPADELIPKQIAAATNITFREIIEPNSNIQSAKETVAKEQAGLAIKKNIIFPVTLQQTSPSSLSKLLGDDHFFNRLEAVRRISSNLSSEEITHLYVLLDKKDGEDPLPVDKMNALKNDVANALIDQKQIPPNLAHNLTVMYENKAHNNVWRDYCIQHLGSLYSKLDDPEEKAALIDVLWKATEEVNLSIGGTGLISLERNINAAGASKERIAAKAIFLAEDQNCGEPTRITALQVCAGLGETKVLETARKIASSRESVPLRMSAIAAVGTLGDETDRSMLEKYSKSSDIRLRTASISALKRLN